jgi:hypothetical protein
MAGYAVTARVARPRMRAGAVVATARSLPSPGPATTFDPEAEDVVGRPLDVAWRERWDDIRRLWAQTTFYLFDPESWR